MKTIKIEFSNKVLKSVTRRLVDEISKLKNDIEKYSMLVAVPVETEMTLKEALEHLSMHSFELSKISTILHSFEEAITSDKVSKGKKQLTLELDFQSVVLLREYLAEMIGAETRFVTDSVFKLQTSILAKQKVKNSTPITESQKLSSSLKLLEEYNDILMTIEKGIEENQMNVIEMLSSESTKMVN